MTEDGTQPPTGRGKDGKPYKDGNTRADGSYEVGKGRPDPRTQFAKGDGRQRGRRAKGTRNLQTDWSEVLSEIVDVTEGGRKRRITKQRAIVKATTVRAMKGSDRAAEIAFRYAFEHDARAGRLQLEDQEIIARFVAERYGQTSTPEVLDDRDSPHSEDEERGDADAGGA